MNRFIRYFSNLFFSPLERSDGNESSRNASICISSRRLHRISRTPPKRAFDYVHCTLRIPSFRVALMAKCYNRPSVSRLSASSFPERRGKRDLPLCRRTTVLLPIASVNVTLCRAIALTCHPRANARFDRIGRRSAACELCYLV